MRKTYCYCPSCSGKLIYCPELKHEPSGRPVFKCGTVGCKHSLKKDWFVLGNNDNFGEGINEKPQSVS